MKKRILALLLAAAMLVTLIPMTSVAAGTTYAITNATPESDKETNHGYIAIDKTSAAEDETVTVTVNPAEGYQLKKLTVLSAISIAPPITPAQDASDKTKYTFTMPGYPVTVTAEFEEVGGTPSGKTLPYSFDFESDFIAAGWRNIDADRDGQDWITGTNNYKDQVLGVNGSKCAVSQSYENIGDQSFNADNWLFSPAITIPAGGAIVSWYEESQDVDYKDSYTVYVGETAVAQAYNESTAPNGMKVLYAYHEAAESWTKISVELSAENYGGKTVYIAFRHLSYDQYFLKIDNFAVEAVAPAHTHAFTYTANNGKITATCADGCDDGYDTNPLTLTLTAPASLVYDGNAKAFTFADGEAAAWTGAGLELPTICYFEKKDHSFYVVINSAPTDAGGDYMVDITVNKKAAEIYFTIDKATPYIKTTPAPNDIEYGKKLSDSTLVGGYVQISSTDSSEVGGLFEWTNPDTVPGIDDSEITEYDVTFTPADTNNYNTVSCKITIKVTHIHTFTGDYVEYETGKWAKKCSGCNEYDTDNALTGVEAPTAKENLIYTSLSQTGVAEGEGYTVTNGKATDAGEYTATVTLKDGYIWSDGTLEAKEIKWSIAERADYSKLDAVFDSISDIVSNEDEYKTLGDVYEAYVAKYIAAGLINGELAKTDENQQLIDNAAKELEEAVSVLRLEKAKEEAIEEIKALVTEESSEEVKAAAQRAIENIASAGTLTAVNEIKTAAIEEINALASTGCKYCGKVHKTWIDEIICFIYRLIDIILHFTNR